MPASTTVNKVLLDAQKISEIWMANPAFTLGDVTQKSFSETSAKATSASEQIEARRIELQGLMNNRDDTVRELQELITRARSGFRATYGPDSSQYEQAGGVRSSERKSRSAARPVTAASAKA